MATQPKTAHTHQANNKYEQDLLDNPALYHQLLYVPGGNFTMGSTDQDAFDDEKPLRQTSISPFYMAKFQVTQALYEAVMDGKNPSTFKSDLACPVQTVSWDDAQAFCTELNKRCGYKKGQGYRLPTEAEWEYAAKGGPKQKKYTYCGSSLLEEVGWYDKNNNVKPRPVGLLLPNSLGLHDMSGNVREWCEDWYANSYDLKDSSDPKGPSEGQGPVLRGGHYWGIAWYCRPSHRGSTAPDRRYSDFGFRLALAPQVKRE